METWVAGSNEKTKPIQSQMPAFGRKSEAPLPPQGQARPRENGDTKSETARTERELSEKTKPISAKMVVSAYQTKA